MQIKINVDSISFPLSRKEMINNTLELIEKKMHALWRRTLELSLLYWIWEEAKAEISGVS